MKNSENDTTRCVICGLEYESGNITKDGVCCDCNTEDYRENIRQAAGLTIDPFGGPGSY